MQTSPNAFRLLDLPDELLLLIGEHLSSESDLNALHRTNRRLYRILHFHLYRSNALHHEGHALFWAIRHEKPATAQKSVLAGTCQTGSGSTTPWPFDWTSGRPSRQYAHTKALVSPTGWMEEPLFVACRYRKPTMVKTLLELGAYSSYQPGRMLYLAAASGWPEIVQVLLEHGVSVDPGHVDMSPLTLAIVNGQSETAEMFFRYGSRVGSGGCQSEQMTLHTPSGGGGDTGMALAI